MTPEQFQITQLDGVEFLQSLPDESVDLIITDVPYESLEKHRERGTTTRLSQSTASSNPWFSIFHNDRFPEFFREAFRVLKNGSHLYFFCDPETMLVAKPIGESAGFKFWKPIIWNKLTMGMGYHYRGQYESILFFEKGKRRLNDLGIVDVLEAPRVRGGYPTEKPVSIAETLVLQSSSPGQVVCDPFCGSGFAGVPALWHGRRFLGNDVASDAVALATHRLTEALQGKPTELTSELPKKRERKARKVA